MNGIGISNNDEFEIETNSKVINNSKIFNINQSQKPIQINHELNNNINTLSQNQELNETENIYEQQISLLKSQLEEIKNTYQIQLDNEKEKTNELKNKQLKEIENLKLQLQNDLITNENIYKQKENLLKEELERIKNDIRIQLENQKNKIEIQQRNELEDIERKNKREIEKINNQNKREIDNLKDENFQMSKLDDLMKKFETSTKKIEDIAEKINDEKEKSFIDDKYSLDNKEKSLLILEEKLNEMEKDLILDRQNLNKKKEELSHFEIEKEKELKNERLKIDQQLYTLKQLENVFNQIDFKQREENDKNKMSLNYEENQINMKIELFNNNLKTKIKEYEQNKKILEEEKKFFENFKNDSIKNIEYQRVNLEQKKRELTDSKIKLKEKVKLIQDKNMYLNQLIEFNDNYKMQLYERENKIKIDDNDIKIAAQRISNEIQNLRDDEQYITLEKERIMSLYQDLDNKKLELMRLQNGFTY